MITQNNIFKKIRNLFSNFETINFNPYNSSIFYLNTNSKTGLYFLNSILKIRNFFFKTNYIFFKEIFYGIRYASLSIHKKKICNYNKIIITWATKKNFNSNGSLQDKYLNINSKKLRKTLWVIIYEDQNLPNSINKNLILLVKKKNIFNFLKFIIFFIKNLKYIFKNKNFFLASIINYNFFAFIFFEQFKLFLNNKIRSIFLMYEGQPFQNVLIKNLKKNYKNINIIGYIHSPPKAIPSNFLYNSNHSPNEIILNGKDQQYCFSKWLGWKKKRIKIIPSFRFLKKKIIMVQKTIFLPLFIENINKVIDNLLYLHTNNYANLKEYRIKDHPINVRQLKNKNLIKKINSKISLLNKPHKKSHNNFLIFIGSTGAIIEHLELGHSVIQITENPLFELYNSKLWPNITTKKIKKNIYVYKLKKKKQLINFGINASDNVKKLSNLLN